MSRKGKGRSAFKGLTGAVLGLALGAGFMYLTPLLDRFFKPAVPVANFEVRKDGLSATFHDLSSGPRNREGWWDFGDGSPLVPLVPGEEVRHTYRRPGGYTAKLTVKNLLGESSERTVRLFMGTFNPNRRDGAYGRWPGIGDPPLSDSRPSPPPE